MAPVQAQKKPGMLPAHGPKKAKAQDWLEAMLDMLGPKVDVLGMLQAMAVPPALEDIEFPKYPKGGGLGDKALWAANYLSAMSQMPGVMPQQGAIVYHGTPHRFAPTAKNKFGEFDLSKMGTGEGAQAYGHGVYLAQLKKIAEEYARKLGAMKGKPTIADGLARSGLLYRKDAGRAIQDLLEMSPDSHVSRQDIDDAIRLIKMRQIGTDNTPGFMYRVNLPDEHIARMLDWDAPLSGQPENVQQAIATLRQTRPHPRVRLDPDLYAPRRNTPLPEWSGSMLYEAFGSPEKASKLLGQRGIPGLRYLDQGSRTAGDGTRNYVVWDPTILEILGIE